MAQHSNKPKLTSSLVFGKNVQRHLNWHLQPLFSRTFKALISPRSWQDARCSSTSILHLTVGGKMCLRMIQKEQWGLNRTPSEVKYEVCGPLLDPGGLSDSCCIMYSARLRPANLLLPACKHLSIKHGSGYAAADSCRNGERLSAADSSRRGNDVHSLLEGSEEKP